MDGDGEARESLEALTRALKLKGQVWFYGACYDEYQLAQLIYDADLCVSPGNVGLTAIHVMMYGCPVITNDDFDHQMPEFEAIQKGRTGEFFKNGDVQSLADTIYSWLHSHSYQRDSIRLTCYKEIDEKWNPYYQMKVIKTVLK